ncbi:MAG: citrate synthase [Nitrospirae bacterium]|nr:citrate synthase [Nitrospirota bacterium]
METSSNYSPGLEGIVAGRTTISEIDEARSSLMFRGYDIRDLATKSTYEETAFLLLNGRLPDAAELAAFESRLKAERGVPGEVIDLLGKIPAHAHSMDVLRTGISLVGLFDPEEWDGSHDANIRKAERIIAKMPTLVALGYRLPHRMKPVEPRDDLPHAANFLYMLLDKEPDGPKGRIFDSSMIIYAEHEYNASSFAAHVTVSTLSDIYSGITAAVGTLKGPLHGGANEEVMKMLIDIGEGDKAEKWVMDRLGRKEKIMGFGHRVYKHGDSRAPILKEASKEVCEFDGYCHWHEIAVKVEEVVKREKGLLPNVDFFTASIYYLMGLPIETFTPVFAMARAAGWCAHVIEQLDDNRLIRPASEYVGQRGLVYKPVGER